MNYIRDSWAANQADVPHYGPVDREIFKVEMRARMKRILEFAQCAVARPVPESEAFVGEHIFASPDTILAWACYEFHYKSSAPVVHFVYTRGTYRRLGLASALLNKAAAVQKDRLWWATHMSRGGAHFMAAHGGTYNPFMHEYLNQKRRTALA